MIEKLFTSKNRVKILGFFYFTKNKSYIREVSNMLKISVSAVKKEMDNLVLLDILEKKDDYYILKENSPIYQELKNILIKTDFIIYPLRKIIEKNTSIKYALVFGSVAHTTAKPESDVDLLIIGKISSRNMYIISDTIEREIKKTVNPTLFSLEELKKKKNTSFVKDIFAKKILMIKGDEHELREIIS